MDSILDSVKKILGIDSEDTNFDTDLIIHINSIFMSMNQMGIGPKNCFSISDKNDTWDDFIMGKMDYEPVKTYMSLRVKMVFDPSASSVVTEAMNKMASELEWRLYVASGQY